MKRDAHQTRPMQKETCLKIANTGKHTKDNVVKSQISLLGGIGGNRSKKLVLNSSHQEIKRNYWNHSYLDKKETPSLTWAGEEKLFYQQNLEFVNFIAIIFLVILLYTFLDLVSRLCKKAEKIDEGKQVIIKALIPLFKGCNFCLGSW